MVYEEAGIALDADPAGIARERWPHFGHLHAYAARQADEAKSREAEDWQVLSALLEDAALGTDAGLWAGSSVAMPDADVVILDIHDLENAPANVQRAQYVNVLGFAWSIIRADRSERTQAAAGGG